MFKVGFIDYFLNEWHADNYPDMLAKATGGEVKVTCAYGLVEKNPNGTGMTNAEWSEKLQIPLVSSVDKLIAESDCLVVLSPDHPEMHWTLCQEALRSGKRVFVDKTFALTRRIAEDLFELADNNKTPVFSCSSLRFANEIKDLPTGGFEFIASRGPGSFETYLIHQLEPIIKLVSDEVRRVMYTGCGATPAMLLEFASGETATTAQFGWDCPFALCGRKANGEEICINEMTDFFDNFIHVLAQFFMGKINVPVPAKDTVTVMSVIEAAAKAKGKPLEWVTIQ
jgi:hypothetical protein